MAIVQNPITGRTKKKFGTAVFSKQFGKNIMRSKPLDLPPFPTKSEELWPGVWKITLAWSEEALHQAAYEMTFWSTSQSHQAL
jgi:hypothetical protein